MRNTVILAVKLFVITAVATAVLAVVNGMTSPIVTEREAKEYNDSLKEVFETADDFKSLSETDKDIYTKVVEGNENVEDIVLAYSGGEEVGYVFKVNGKGYGGPITFVIGVDKEATILGYKVLISSETKGFGSQVAEDPFVSSVVGNKLDQEIVSASNPSTDYDIQAISGTTISVKGILSGLNGAVKALSELGM